jgi:hypothetical protein
MTKTRMVGLISAAMIMAVSATSAAAQQAPQAPSDNSWVAGVDVAPGSWVKTTSLTRPFGAIRSASGDKSLGVEEKKDPWASAFLGYKPFGAFGGEVRGQKFGASGEAIGAVPYADGKLVLWGVDGTPKITSTAPVLLGPMGYTLKSSAKVSRVDLLGNYSWWLPRGWVSGFGGVSVLRVKSIEDVTRAQKVLLSTLNPDRSVSTIGIREDYNYLSVASSKSTLYGLGGGVEGEYCLIGGLVLDGRVAVTFFPWGKTKVNGQFSATKDIYLVAVAGGVNATPTSTLAHLNWAPTAMPYAEAVKGTVTALDVKFGLKWRFGVGRSSLDVGLGVARSSLSKLPVTPGYMIDNPFAVGYGKWGARTAKVAAWAPVLRIGMSF